MATREANFWGRIVEGCWAANRHFDRIENGVLDGMPDSYVCIAGVMNWIELKCPIEPKRATTALFSGNHKLSQNQMNWLKRHRQAGGRGWVAIETERWVLLVGAIHADIINNCTLEQLKQLAAFVGPRPMKPDAWINFISKLNNLGRTP